MKTILRAELREGKGGGVLFFTFGRWYESTMLTNVIILTGRSRVTEANLEMVKGSTAVYTLTVTTDGVAFDLTGCEVIFTAKYDYTDVDNSAVFQLKVGTGVTLTTPASGIATITISAARTANLPNREVLLVFDVKVVDATIPYVVARGTLTVRPQVGVAVA